ncbi:hypothetical protein, partial [Xylella fastidiosa]|uniref:hypothetical protein n=1 Tax=Xylella fastidiosa TaxID=2371 RepID=UPI0011B7F107
MISLNAAVCNIGTTSPEVYLLNNRNPWMKGHMRIKTGIKKALILILSVVLVSLVAIAAHRFYIRLPQSRL